MRDLDLFLRKALLERGSVDAPTLDTCARHAQAHQTDLAAAILATGVLSSRELSLVRAELCEVPYVDVGDFEVCYGNVRLIPRSVAERYCVMPLFQAGEVLTVGMDDPMNLTAMDQVRQLVKCEVDAVLCERDKLQALIARAYTLTSSPGQSDSAGKGIELEAVDDDAASQPIVAAVNQLLADAAAQGASDIHVNPDEHELRMRYRIDGVLHERQGPGLSMHAGIVQRLKVIANLDLTQSRRPQDGKFRFKHDGQPIEVRLSTLPTVCGENVVLRLLTNRQSITDFRHLGVPTDVALELERVIAQPYGMLLVAGPTGSGKTTTLYTALHALNDPATNIITVEDPVEIRLPYVRQVQVNADIGMTFASALRSILRQDPDIVLVGEIRDTETAAIALQAALTGHLVLSTVHTNDAAAAIARLRDFGLPAFVVNSAVLGILAQRLIRRICSHCVSPEALDGRLASRFGIPGDTQGLQRGRGCTRCGRTGYRGRIGMYELLRLTPDIQALAEQGASAERVRQCAIASGMRPMWQDGLDKARLGLTTLEEVAKSAMIDEATGWRQAA